MRNKIHSCLIFVGCMILFMFAHVLASEFNDELNQFNWMSGSSWRMPGPTSRSLESYRDIGNQSFKISVPFEKNSIDYKNILDGTLLKPGLKNSDTRKLLYKQLFLSLILQQEINKYIEQNYESVAKLDNEMKKFRALKSLSDQARKFLEYKSSKQVAFKDIQTTLPEWAAKIENEKLAENVRQLGGLLRAISYAEAISADAMEVMLLHTLATAEADERLQALRDLVYKIPADKEPVLRTAWTEAEKTYEDIKRDRWSALSAALSNIWDLRTTKLITREILMKAWETAFNKIAHGLAVKYGYAAVHGPAIAVVYLVELGIKLEGNYDLLREVCAATTFSYWVWKSTEDWQKASGNDMLKKQATIYNLRSYLGFLEFEFLRDCYTADIFDPDFLLTWLYSFQYKDIVDGFAETRDKYIDCYKLSLLPLKEIKEPPSAIAQSILIILDTSGSMKDPVEGTNLSKFSAAVNAILEVVTSEAAEKANAEWALMTYDGCGRAPIRQHFTTDPANVAKIITTLAPEGNTPLAYSLATGADYIWQNARGEEGLIILLSDGGETCNGDPVEAAGNIFRTSQSVKTKGISLLLKKLGVMSKAYAQGGVSHTIPIELSIVGFNVNDPTERAQLEAITKAAHGTYYHIVNIHQLADQIKIILAGSSDEEIWILIAFALAFIFVFFGATSMWIFRNLRKSAK